MLECKEALIKCASVGLSLENCGDVLLIAEGYLRHKNLAVAIKGNREEWNMKMAKEWAEKEKKK